MTQPFSAPAPAGSGDRLPMEGIGGHLLIIAPKEIAPAFFLGKPIPNTNPPAMSSSSDAVRVNVVDLDAQGGPAIYLDVMWGAKLVTSSLARSIEANVPLVLARLALGVKRGANNAPWKLDDATAVPADVTRASAWLASNPTWEQPRPASATPAHHGTPDAMPGWAGQPAQSAPVDPAYAAFLAAQQAGYAQHAPAPAPVQPAAPVDPAYAAWLAQQQQTPAPAVPAAAPAGFAPGQVNLNDPAVQALLAQLAQQQGR